jgi:two-component system, LytTR family, response regulator
MPYRVLLVDDERLARARLRDMLAEFSEINVVAEADSVAEALAAVEKHHPEIIFLDIQMPGQSGFDFLEQVKRRVQLIFVTAYDQFAVKAFEVNGLDYLMKPVERERLEHAVRRILGPPVKYVNHWRMHEEDYVYVTSTFAARFIQVKKIRYIIAAGPYSEIVTTDVGNWLMPRSIADWQRRLPSDKFVRIHRSAIVNLDFVDRIERLPNYSGNVFLRDSKEPLGMSRRCAIALKDRMK